MLQSRSTKTICFSIGPTIGGNRLIAAPTNVVRARVAAEPDIYDSSS